MKILFEVSKVVAGFLRGILIVSLAEIGCSEAVGDRLAFELLAQANSVS